MKNINAIRTILDMIEKELEQDEKHKDTMKKIKEIATDEEMEANSYQPYVLAWKYNIPYENPSRPTVVERLCVTARQMIKELY